MLLQIATTRPTYASAVKQKQHAAKGSPGCEGTSKTQAQVEKTVYDALPKDLRHTAKQMDRIDELRGKSRLVQVLERIAEAVQPRQYPQPAAMQAGLTRVRELQAYILKR